MRFLMKGVLTANFKWPLGSTQSQNREQKRFKGILIFKLKDWIKNCR